MSIYLSHFKATWRWQTYFATISYIAMIVLLNTLFVSLPGVAAFGQSFSPADLFVGSIYLVRDFAQREIHHRVLIAMLIGAFISYFLADKTIAVASLGAFLIGESLDWVIFTFTRKPLSQRLLLSSFISTPFDSLVFLWLAQRLHWFEFTIMGLGKLLGILILWLSWKYLRRHTKTLITSSQ